MTTTTRNPLRAMTEKSWQDTVLDGLRLHGWVVFHDRVPLRSEPGFPDLTCVNVAQRRVIWLELKTERGRLTEAQRAWGELLQDAGQEWYCWRPSSWASAERVMRGASEPPLARRL